MEIPVFALWIILGGTVLGIIASVLSFKYINPQPLKKRRKTLLIIFLSGLALLGIIALLGYFCWDIPPKEIFEDNIIMIIFVLLIYTYAFFIDPIIRKKKGTE